MSEYKYLHGSHSGSYHCKLDGRRYTYELEWHDGVGGFKWRAQVRLDGFRKFCEPHGSLIIKPRRGTDYTNYVRDTVEAWIAGPAEDPDSMRGLLHGWIDYEVSKNERKDRAKKSKGL